MSQKDLKSKEQKTRLLRYLIRKSVDSENKPDVNPKVTNYDNHDINILNRMLRSMRPPKDLKVSEWAESFRILSSASAVPGRWRNDIYPYQKEPMDVVNDPKIETVVLMWSAQTGKTEIGINTLFYYMHQDPSPMLVALPNDRFAKEFSSKRLNSEIKNSPVVKNVLSGRDAVNNQSLKKYSGGFLKIVGTKVASALASDPIRIAYMDEIDRFEDDVEGEGDPISLIKKRTTTFHNRKLIMTSTPTKVGESQIEELFNKSDKRYYYVPCPHCGFYQTLEFKNFKWVLYAEENFEEFKDLYFQCINKSCEKKINERYKNSMVRKGKWRKTRPDVKKTAGFHINEFYAKRSWTEILGDYLKDDRQEKRRAFWNLSLGLPYDDIESRVNWKDLYKRRENYKLQEVPPRVKFLIAGVDIQQRYIEYVVKGYLENQESYVIDHQVVYQRKGLEECLQEVEKQIFDKKYYGLMDKSKEYQVFKMAVDTGHWAKPIYGWWNDSLNRSRIILVKGKATFEKFLGEPKEIDFIYNNRKQRAKLHMVGTDNMKDFIYKNLEKMPPHKEYSKYIEEEDFPKGFVHFPSNLKIDFFRSLTAEHKVKEIVGERFKYKWKIGSFRRNEVLDCFVYADAVASRFKWGYYKADRLANLNQLALNFKNKDTTNSSIVSEDAFGSSSYFDL